MASQQIFSFVVSDPVGLHARPISQIVKLAQSCDFRLGLRRPGAAAVSADSALRLLSMKVASGEPLELVIETDDDSAARAIALEFGELLARPS